MPEVLVMYALTFKGVSVLDFLQNVRIVNMILNWVSNWIVSGHVLILEVSFSLLPLPLLLHLDHDFISEGFLARLLFLKLVLVLKILIVFQLFEGLVLFSFLL